MAGFIDTLLDKLAARIVHGWASTNEQAEEVLEARKYRLGAHKEQLKLSRNGHNDNVTLNFCGLVINRGVSQTIGKGVTLKFEGDDGKEDSPNAAYVKAVLKANKEEILFHRSLLFAGEDGTGYWMLVPDGAIGKDGVVYPRIVALDPIYMTIHTKFGDMEVVEAYQHEYKETDPITQKEVGFRKVVRRNNESEVEQWLIEDFENRNGRWEPTTPPVAWPWPWSPVIHWQNLPSTHSVYGESDITGDLYHLQDQINYDASNINKVIRLYAHPQRYAKGLSGSTITVGPDEMPQVSENGDIVQLPPIGDMPAAQEFLLTLRQAFFDVSRTVDITSLDDKLGALTNFGLRVLYQDNTAKIDTKRELFGDALEELCVRLQNMGGFEAVEVTAVWPEWMPENAVETITTQQQEIDLGVVSRQTIAEERGRDWEQEQERIGGEKAQGDNIGAALLRQMNRGQEGGIMPDEAQLPPLVV